MSGNEVDITRQCARYCSASERCVSEVRKRLDGLGIDEAARERVLSSLVNEGFIDEARYCKAFVNDKFRFNKWGRRKIAFELRRKGIATSLIEEALAAIDPDRYSETLKALLQKKKSSVKAKNGRELTAKLAAYAVSKGFEAGQVFDVIKQLTGYDDESLD